MSNSTVRNSRATGGHGGGIRVHGGSATITSSTISGNSATGSGGGVSVDNAGNLTLSRSAITSNTATVSGGGIHIDSEYLAWNAVKVENSTISGNQARRGGGISVSAYGDIKIRFNTIVNNSATGGGGGIDHNQSYSGYKLSVIRNIFADNSAHDCYAFDAYDNFRNNYVKDGTCEAHARTATIGERQDWAR